MTDKFHNKNRLHITDNTILSLAFLFNELGGGGKILWYTILIPQPNIQKRYFDNGVQCQLSFIPLNIYISQTILFHG